MATRRERVVLELEDRFTSDMARAAAAAALLNRELDSLSKDSIRTKRSMSDIDKGVVVMGSHSEKSGSQIDKLSGRVRILADVAAILGPSLIPIGGVGIAAIGGLANQFGFAAIGAGTAVLAFQGVGDALKAVNKAAIEPTAANLDAARLALDKLGPSGREFVAELRNLIPQLKELQTVAANGLLPGAAEGLEALTTVLPRLESIVSAVSTELGNIAADTGKSLASDRWTPFLEFIGAEAPKVLGDLADIIGNTGHALAELWMAFTPLNNGFSDFLVTSTEELDKWAAGLSQTQGFQDFVAYIQETGPQVAETFGAISNAIVQIVEAASPLGGPVLQGVTGLANALASIADSDLGTPLFAGAAALALINRTLAITGALEKRTFGGPAVLLIKGQSTAIKNLTADWAAYNSVSLSAGARARATRSELVASEKAAGRLGDRLRTIGKGTAIVGGLAVASTGAADSIGLTNTASLALLGTMGGAPGVLAGGLIGAFLDAQDASKKFGDAVKQADRDLASHAGLDKLNADLKKLKEQEQDLKPKSEGFSIKNIPQNLLGGITDPFQNHNGDLADNRAAQNRIKFFGTLRDSIQQVATAQDFANEGFRQTATGLDAATQSAQDYKTAIEEVQAVLEGRSTFRDFEQSIDDFTARQKKRIELQKQLKESIAEANKSGASPSEQNRINKLEDRIDSGKTAADRKKARGDLAALEATIANRESESRKRALEDVKRLRTELATYEHTLDTTTQAGRDNAAALDAIATSALNYANTIKDPVLKSAFLDNAREQFIRAAKAAGATDQAAKDLATQVGLLDGVTGKVKIIVDDNGTIRIVDELTEKLKRLKRLGDLHLNITAGQNKRDQNEFGPQIFPADGITVPGQRFPYGDKIHALLAPGEEVISNRYGQADRWRALLKQINANRMAGGGTVQPFASNVSNTWNNTSSRASGLSTSDLRAIATLVAASRPMYGDAHFHGDHTQWRRQMNEDTALAGLGGRR